ncbi:unnamed protein product [Ambrosiozyma monospora]|uniref:Unnamed protein product n=1 Tax=Ambrosiozyma monospora TaxID=43982 RepID=A0ACB5TC58_AMBMO|nr:unnamed protein product [Ambrosiozyma monospora]
MTTTGTQQHQSSHPYASRIGITGGTTVAGVRSTGTQAAAGGKLGRARSTLVRGRANSAATSGSRAAAAGVGSFKNVEFGDGDGVEKVSGEFDGVDYGNTLQKLKDFRINSNSNAAGLGKVESPISVPTAVAVSHSVSSDRVHGEPTPTPTTSKNAAVANSSNVEQLTKQLMQDMINDVSSSSSSSEAESDSEDADADVDVCDDLSDVGGSDVENVDITDPTEIEEEEENGEFNTDFEQKYEQLMLGSKSDHSSLVGVAGGAGAMGAKKFDDGDVIEEEDEHEHDESDFEEYDSEFDSDVEDDVPETLPLSGDANKRTIVHTISTKSLSDSKSNCKSDASAVGSGSADVAADGEEEQEGEEE